MIDVWQNQVIQDIHRQMIAEQGIVQKVLSTELSIVRGTMHLEHTYVVSHTLLERFVTRCLLELAPCSTEQIAILLGIRNVGFVDVIVETFAARGYICKDEANKWVVKDEILRLCYERGEYQEIKSKPGYMFYYEWKHNFFLPKETVQT